MAKQVCEIIFVFLMLTSGGGILHFSSALPQLHDVGRLNASLIELDEADVFTNQTVHNRNFTGSDGLYTFPINSTHHSATNSSTFLHPDPYINDSSKLQDKDLFIMRHHNTSEDHLSPMPAVLVHHEDHNTSVVIIDVQDDETATASESSILEAMSLSLNTNRPIPVAGLNNENGSAKVAVTTVFNRSVLELHPNVQNDNHTISFSANDSSTWAVYVSEMTQFLEDYSKEEQEKNVHCDFEHAHSSNHACFFDLVYLGPSCTKQNSFGYGIGKPCVLLSPSNMGNWVPAPFDNSTSEVPDEVQRLMRIFNSNFMFVTCQGESESDRANIGPLAYLPPYQGFPSFFFPDKSQSIDSYVAPVMAIEFLNPVNGTTLNVICRAWASNLNDVSLDATLRFSMRIN